MRRLYEDMKFKDDRPGLDYIHLGTRRVRSHVYNIFTGCIYFFFTTGIMCFGSNYIISIGFYRRVAFS